MLDRIRVWAPQSGPQKALIDCPHPEIFFGGARGGGKTDGVLGKWAIKERRYGSNFNAIMFRKTTVSSEDAIDRSKQIYRPLGGKFNESKLIWKMPNGGRVSFAYLDSVSDAEEYQGRNVTDVWIEEAGQYPDAGPIDRLFGVMRSAASVPVQMILTANPGGSGQQWIRERYQLVPFPHFPKVVCRELPDGGLHKMAVIPSRITDNKILLDSDPTYLSRLQMVGGKALIKAWLEGDWSAIEGAFFDGWDNKRHVVTPFEIPQHWTRIRSMDWGFAAPFSVGWWAVASEPVRRGEILIPRGCMVRYREWYGASGPNVGLRLEAEQIAAGIQSRENGEKITDAVLDPACFNKNGAGYGYKGPTIAERMAATGVMFRGADNTRVAQRGAIGGWDQLRSRLLGDLDGNPMLVVFETCKDFIRLFPTIQHDPVKVEDIDTDAEDHLPDETRYAAMSRPWARPTPIPEKSKQINVRPLTFDDLDRDDGPMYGRRTKI